MTDKVQVYHKPTGKFIVLEIEEGEWKEFESNYLMAVKEYITCQAYVYFFTKNKRTGEIDIIFFEATEED